jgi:hypothetical protein
VFPLKQSTDREEDFMRRMGLLAISCVSLMILIVCANYLTNPRNGKPLIMLPEGKYDFGHVKSWEILEHTFRIRNKGDTVLRIERVSPD